MADSAEIPDQTRAPYAEALVQHAARNPEMFMVPAHGATPTGLSTGLAEFIGEQAVRLDIPQFVDGIDAGAGSPLEQAIALAADAWSARRTWFLSNGSSQGNRMAVIAASAIRPSGALIAQRSAHSSLLDGLVVTGTPPEWIMPEIDRERGINHGVTPEALDQQFRALSAAGERASAAYVISPSYFGAVADINGLAEVAHEHGVPLIVDAAWGAHFGFHPALPAFPTTLGADIVVTSTHKMGGSLGQSAMLHLADGPFAAELEGALDRAFHLTQTTSVSSLLLGSLDIARRSLATRADLIGDSLARADQLREQVRAHPQLDLVSDGFGDYASILTTDPLRVAIDLSGTGVTGYQMRSELMKHHAVFLEIATASAIVAFLGPGKELDTERLLRAIQAVSDAHSAAPAATVPVTELPEPGPRIMTPREAFFAESELIPSDDAIGRVSADALSAYPPGIPNIAPGEQITRESLEFLRGIVASPIGFVRGASRPDLSHLRVVK